MTMCNSDRINSETYVTVADGVTLAYEVFDDRVELVFGGGGVYSQTGGSLRLILNDGRSLAPQLIELVNRAKDDLERMATGDMDTSLTWPRRAELVT
jgi:hypothetical protein